MSDAQSWLLKLIKSPRAQAIDAASLLELEAAGLVVSKRNRAGLATVALTEAGALRKKAIQDELKAHAKAAKGASKPKKKTTVADLELRVEALERQLAQLVSASEPSTQAVDPSLLDQAVGEALSSLERERYSSGVVPIPALRDRVIARTGASRLAVDERLVAMERSRQVQLSAANDPARIDRSLAIDAGPRGWLYFAMRHEGAR